VPYRRIVMKLFKINVIDITGVWFVHAPNEGEALLKFLGGEHITEAHLENKPGPENPTFENPDVIDIRIEEVV
jgi:hypothetical protein